MVAYRYFTISQTDERNEAAATTRGGGFSEYIGISEPLTFPMAKWDLRNVSESVILAVFIPNTSPIITYINRQLSNEQLL